MGDSVSVTLTPELERFVDERMEKSGHASRSEAVRAILQRVMEYEEERKAKLESLRADIQHALDQVERGEVSPLNVEEIIAAGEKRLAEKRAQQRRVS